MEITLNRIKTIALPLFILITKTTWILFQGLLSLITIILRGSNDDIDTSDEDADSYEDIIVNHLTMEADYGLDPYGLYERDYK